MNPKLKAAAASLALLLPLSAAHLPNHRTDEEGPEGRPSDSIAAQKADKSLQAITQKSEEVYELAEELAVQTKESKRKLAEQEKLLDSLREKDKALDTEESELSKQVSKLNKQLKSERKLFNENKKLLVGLQQSIQDTERDIMLPLAAELDEAIKYLNSNDRKEIYKRFYPEIRQTKLYLVSLNKGSSDNEKKSAPRKPSRGEKRMFDQIEEALTIAENSAVQARKAHLVLQDSKMASEQYEGEVEELSTSIKTREEGISTLKGKVSTLLSKVKTLLKQTQRLKDQITRANSRAESQKEDQDDMTAGVRRAKHLRAKRANEKRREEANARAESNARQNRNDGRGGSNGTAK